MKIIHVVPCIDPEVGGPAQSVPAFAAGLRSIGVESSLVTFSRTVRRGCAEGTTQGVPTRFFHPWLWTRQFPSPDFLSGIGQLLHEADLVHLHSYFNPCIELVATLCRLYSKPYVVAPMGMLHRIAMDRRRLRKTLYHWARGRAALAGASGLHFLTRGELQAARSFIPAESRCFIVPNGIELTDSRDVRSGAFRSRYPELNGCRFMLFVGRLHWSKRLEMQVEALERIAATRNDLCLTIVGPDDGEEKMLRQMIDEKGLNDRVVWTGLLGRQECLEALRDADVFVMTSRHEGHSIAMNEALAMGTPVVLSESVGFPEVEEWGAGRVVANDSRAIAEAVLEIVSNPAVASSMHEAGRYWAAKALSPQSVATQLSTVYAELVRS